jgi:hypothetical protein
MIPLNPASPLVGTAGTDDILGARLPIAARTPKPARSARLSDFQEPSKAETAAAQDVIPRNAQRRGLLGQAHIACRRPWLAAHSAVRPGPSAGDRRHAHGGATRRFAATEQLGALAVTRKGSEHILLTRGFSGLGCPPAAETPGPGPGGRRRSADGCYRRDGRAHRPPVSSNGPRGGRRSR